MRCVCGSEAFQKFGTYYRDGQRIQRLKCKACELVTSDTSLRPLGSLRVPLEKATLIVRLLVEGNGIRGVSRITGLHQQTILNVLETAGRKCTTLLDERIRGVRAEQIEVDELYSYVGCRPEHANPYETGRGEIYTFLGIDRGSKLILSTLVGKRYATNCLAIMKDIKSRLAPDYTPQVSTDGFPAYVGNTGAVFKAFGAAVNYGIEVKQYGREEGPVGRYKPAKCLGATRRAQLGFPNLSTVNTSRVERCNLSVRHFNRRFTRSTLGFSRKIQNHRHTVSLFAAHFNFCRCHSSLKNGIARTPAMAAGLTDHVWTIAELLRETA